MSLAAAAASVLAVASVPASAAVVLTFDSSAQSTNSPHTGASGKATFEFLNLVGGGYEIKILIENTTGQIPVFGAGATQSQLTGFAFDAPTGQTHTGFVGGNTLTNLGTNQGLPSLPTFDFCVQDPPVGGEPCQAGAPNGITQGNSDAVTLQFASSLLSAAAAETTWLAFLQDVPPVKTGMRFMDVNAGAGSDVLYNPTVVPLPAAAWLMVAGLGGLGLVARRRKAA